MRSYPEIIRNRRSVRAFTSQVVSDADIHSILEAGACAPSACNKQPWTFYVVKSEEAKKLVAETCTQPWFATAPDYIVIVGNNARAWRRPSGNSVDIDTSIATTQMMLEAEYLGLATTWVCAFDQDKMHDILNLKEEEVAVSILALGYPDDAYRAAAPYKRKPIEELVRYI